MANGKDKLLNELTILTSWFSWTCKNGEKKFVLVKLNHVFIGLLRVLKKMNDN